MFTSKWYDIEESIGLLFENPYRCDESGCDFILMSDVFQLAYNCDYNSGTHHEFIRNVALYLGYTIDSKFVESVYRRNAVIVDTPLK